MKDLNVTINKFSFNIGSILGHKKDHPDISKLIAQVKATDSDFEVTEPMEEDINFESDRWEVWSAYDESLFFEFLKGRLICISFVLKNIDDEVIQLSDDIQKLYSKEMLEMKDYYTKRRDGYYQRALDSHLVVGLIEDENQKECITVISFGDYETFSNEENLPNRYSDILGSLILV